MAHLGVFRFWYALPQSSNGLHSDQYPADDLGSTFALPGKSTARSNVKQVLVGDLSAKGSPIWPRVSQNAAALLFDLGTVDVR
jgi:hypothetical protein